MKKILLLCFILVFTVEARPLNELYQTLKSWSPLSVAIKNKTIIIISNKEKVSEKIYNSMLLLGVCGTVWSNDSEVLEGATEIHILNSHKRQGYVFEGGAQECKELGKLKGKESDFFILGHTHLYSVENKTKA